MSLDTLILIINIVNIIVPKVAPLRNEAVVIEDNVLTALKCVNEVFKVLNTLHCIFHHDRKFKISHNEVST